MGCYLQAGDTRHVSRLDRALDKARNLDFVRCLPFTGLAFGQICRDDLSRRTFRHAGQDSDLTGVKLTPILDQADANRTYYFAADEYRNEQPVRQFARPAGYISN